MNYLFDIGHPAHVHYFRNLIKNLIKDNHNVIVVARNRNLIFNLLDHYKIPYIKRGKGGNNLLGKVLYTFKADIQMLILGIKHKIDIFISFSTGYPAHVGWLLNRTTITLNDTEHSHKVLNFFVYPFSTIVFVPNTYYENIGLKGIKLNNLIEGLYLHPNYYSPKQSIKSLLGLQDSDKYVLIRFISWQAYHDIGYIGLNNDFKLQLIKTVSKKFKVFISSEYALPAEYRRYALNIPPGRIHDVLYYATFVISESGTMASEASYLGTHVIYTNNLPLMGYLKEAQNSGLLFHETNEKKILSIIELLSHKKGIIAEGREKSQKMKFNYIDITLFLTWFLENYPNSYNKIRQNSLYQNSFK